MSIEQPKFARLTAEDIDQGVRRIRLLPAHLKTSWEQMREKTPMLATLMEYGSNRLPKLWGDTCRPAFLNGISASHLLLRDLSNTHNIAFPKEASTGNLEHDLVANYGSFESIHELNATFMGRLNNLTTDSDLLAETTSVRHFQSLHPLWFSAGVRLAARHLRRPPQYFDTFLADGRLLESTTSTPVTFPHFNPEHVRPVETQGCDKFAMFSEGFGVTTRIILNAEVKRDFEQQFPH